jgi:hypothetical protein
MDVIETEELTGKGMFGVGGSGMHHIGTDGRFRITGVIPTHKVGVYAGKNTTYFDPVVTGVILQPGELKDLGDVRGKPSQ